MRLGPGHGKHRPIVDTESPKSRKSYDCRSIAFAIYTDICGRIQVRALMQVRVVRNCATPRATMSGSPPAAAPPRALVMHHPAAPLRLPYPAHFPQARARQQAPHPQAPSGSGSGSGSGQ